MLENLTVYKIRGGTKKAVKAKSFTEEELLSTGVRERRGLLGAKAGMTFWVGEENSMCPGTEA